MIKNEEIYLTFENGTFVSDAISAAIAYRRETPRNILFDFNGVRFTVEPKSTVQGLLAYYESSLRNGSKRDSYWNLMQVKNR